MGTAQSGMCLIPADFLQRPHWLRASCCCCHSLCAGLSGPPDQQTSLCVPLALSLTHVCTHLVRELVSKSHVPLSACLSVSLRLCISVLSRTAASHIPSTHVHHVTHCFFSRSSCRRQPSSRSRSDALSAGSFRARRLRYLLCRCSPRRARSPSLSHSLSLSLFIGMCLLPLSSSPSCEALRHKPL